MTADRQLPSDWWQVVHRVGVLDEVMPRLIAQHLDGSCYLGEHTVENLHIRSLISI